MKIKLLKPGAKIPVRIDSGAAGYDVYVPEDVVINPGRNLIKLGIQIELDPGYECQIRPRSGFSLKGVEGYLPSSDTAQRFDADVLLGTVDESYRGEVGVIIKSYEKNAIIIKQGTRIAQMVIEKYYSEPFELTEELSSTERSEKGFGDSGSK